MSIGSNGFAQGGRVNKTDKTRRSWSVQEEVVLLAALKELVAQGWKSDNGFHAGYLNKLEDAIKKEYPNSDLKGMPHINSKVTTWKKTYNSLTHILKFSGVGFNAKGTFMIDCDNEQWENIVRTDKNISNMRFKSWPYHDDWKIIFGKDRANGDEAEDLMEAAHDMYRNIDLNPPIDPLGDYHVSLEDIFENGEMADSVSQTHKPEVTKKGDEEVRASSRKRKRSSGIDDRMFEAFSDISRGTESRLEIIVESMGYDKDVSKARKEVFAQLSAIPGLSKTDKFEITDLLAKEVERLDVFASLPDEEKADYVFYLLDMKRK
ncbi:uncharacterized protein LOC131026082 [Salvia miltiorrhiza]|uniref:uncharacterized protein LOC131026082 n=1 Tax=Salvia miltiorrhiza TaxID=226208 RepID=UPI0025AC4D10|nr:uncharacterized protein LOC131026082 [Salvia miltiorrhiza]